MSHGSFHPLSSTPIAACRRHFGFRAKQITIVVLNGRNGVPMKNQTVFVWFGKINPSPLNLTTDTDGKVVFTVESGQDSFLVAVAEQFVVDCRSSGPAHFGDYVYRASEVLERGIAAANRCGTTPSSVPTAGQLTLFVRRFKFSENVRHFFHPD